MKKTLLILFLAMLGWKQNAQTIAVQFYVDANNDCTYNAGEQLIYNIPCDLTYLTSGNQVQLSSYWGGTLTSCSALTLYLWNPSVTPTNTFSIGPVSGITPNLS